MVNPKDSAKKKGVVGKFKPASGVAENPFYVHFKVKEQATSVRIESESPTIHPEL
jgi:hypothetical protein